MARRALATSERQPAAATDDVRPLPAPVRLTDRYTLFARLAAGGMATVHIGRLIGPVAFARTVAVKRLLPQYASDPDFRLMLTDEARLAARVRHPNVVQMLDVVSTEEELFLVMEYVDGVALRRLLGKAKAPVPPVPQPIMAAIIVHLLHGLHAAHMATDEQGVPLGIIHRDVSPDNVLVGADGLARVLDFGIAKATSRLQSTRDGQIKGKLAYMAPEQLRGRASQQSDVFSASIILWEGLVGDRLFRADDEGETMGRVLDAVIEPPASLVAGVHPRLSEIVMRGLQRDPAQRWPSAREMALAIEESVPLATASQIASWVEAGGWLDERRELVRRIEGLTLDDRGPVPPPEQAAVATGVSWAARPPTAPDEPAAPDDAAIPPGSIAPRAGVRTSRYAVGLAAAACGVGLVLWAARSQTPFRATVPPPPSFAAAVQSAPPPGPSALPAAILVTDVPPAAPVSPAPVVSSSPVASAASSVVRTPRRPAPTVTAATRPPTNACDPPYRIGPMGEKIWLKSCL